MLKQNLIAKLLSNRKIDDDGCWLWTKSVTSKGYGQFMLDRQSYSTHRAAYIAFIGDIPDGLFVLHKCDVRRCFNPDHLFLGTQKDNIQDMWNKERVLPMAGEDAPRGKLTEEQAMWVKECDLTNVEVARILNINPSSVSRIRSGINWKYL